MKNETREESGYYDIDDLICAQRLSYGERMELLDRINEFLMRTMPQRSKEISLILKRSNF
jgi:hypothetical protein